MLEQSAAIEQLLQASLLPQERRLAEDPVLQAMVEHLQQRFGDALDAIVLYGSYLRGASDSLIDLYVLLDDAKASKESFLERLGRRLLAPNVYYLSATEVGDMGHAKYATVGTERLARQVENAFHSYFWARWAQPCALLYRRNEACARRVLRIRAAAVTRCLREAQRLTPNELEPVEPLARWQALFQHTYQCELRSEAPNRGQTLLDFDAAYYRDLACHAQPIQPVPAISRSAIRARRWLGKGLSLTRLCKAAFTFSNGLDYLLWKVERHSGLKFEATERQRRYPLLFAWPLVWRAYRAGGFR